MWKFQIKKKKKMNKKNDFEEIKNKRRMKRIKNSCYCGNIKKYYIFNMKFRC